MIFQLRYGRYHQATRCCSTWLYVGQTSRDIDRLRSDSDQIRSDRHRSNFVKTRWPKLAPEFDGENRQRVWQQHRSNSGSSSAHTRPPSGELSPKSGHSDHERECWAESCRKVALCASWADTPHDPGELRKLAPKLPQSCSTVAQTLLRDVFGPISNNFVRCGPGSAPSLAQIWPTCTNMRRFGPCFGGLCLASCHIRPTLARYGPTLVNTWAKAQSGQCLSKLARCRHSMDSKRPRSFGILRI